MFGGRVNHLWSLSFKHVWAGAFVLAIATASPAPAQKVRITKLTDVDFSTITNFGVDQVRTQSVCAYSTSTRSRYNVKASGSGAGGAFTLASGTRTLPYEVQWSAVAGATTGTALTSNVAAGGFIEAATNETCSSAPTATASLIVILRSNQILTATAGAYSGVLTITLAPE